MEHQFWHQRWADNQIGFHASEVNPLLQAHLKALALPPGARRVLVPLCGKTRDMGWLRAQGFEVVGIELSEVAVRQFFDELGKEPEVTAIGPLRCYRVKGIAIYVGDIFDVTSAMLGEVAAIYDRAALIALPDDLQRRYAAHLVKITNAAPQLLITVVYDQSIAAGPPFSTGPRRVETLYRETYQIEHIASVTVEGGLKGTIPATDDVWILKTKNT